ncbi:MAG: VPLPA-CTERM sorting domain-containing protein [Gammaproteobacteria bacterium]|nr:VPLPA-CTERM sorting domain-containing protein [Gammaproteobacteria bacterium]
MKSSYFVKTSLILAMLSPAIANSAIVHIGSGNTVDFYYDDADTGTLAYGTMQISGDTIFATPSTFEASALNGDGTTLFSNTGSVFVTAKDGYSFSSVGIIEGGTYNTTGNGTVDVSSSIRVMDSDNIFTQQTSYLNITDLSIPGENSWQGELSYDMTTGMWDSTNSIQLTLSTLLYATSPDAGSTATINQTLTGSSLGMSVTTVIPVPAAVWLFGSGLIGLAGIARRKKA